MRIATKLRALCLALLLVASVACAETVLHEQAGMFGTLVVSEDEDGMRVLRFERGGARQSLVKPGDPDYLGLPYARFALAGLAAAGEPRRILVVGLGGGSLPMFLRRHYPDATIDAVDIDPAVVDVAKRFFGFREDARMRAHVGDGRAFIEAVREPYDAIFLDAFATASVPPHLTTEEFLRAARRAVGRAGVIIGNIWSPWANPLYDAMVRTYQEVFEDLYVLEVRGSGNRILLALPRREGYERVELARRAREVSTVQRFGFDAGEMVEYGFRHLVERRPDARVLRDPEVGARRQESRPDAAR